MASRYSIHPQIWQRLYHGPLGPAVDALVTLLEEQGYCPNHIAIHVRAAAAVSCWLERQESGAAALTPEGLERYARFRQQRVAMLLDERDGLARQTVREQYLVRERGLARTTVRNYLPIVGQFLPECFGRGPLRFAALTPADITRFVQRHAREGSVGRARLLVTRLRAFLRYLRFRAAIATDMAGCVPSVAPWDLAAVPKALPRGAVRRVLADCDRRTPAGRRDYAILLLFARLGLRAGEVVGLTLDDLDWEAGRLHLRSKGGRRDDLPLPADVGAAVAAYLQRGRPPCASRCLFLRLRAPWGGLGNATSISTLVARRLAHAGVQAPHTGAHVFRHTLAAELLRHGASLVEIGALLRHRSPTTTALYAKVDFAALRPLALPWPGGGR